MGGLAKAGECPRAPTPHERPVATTRPVEAVTNGHRKLRRVSTLTVQQDYSGNCILQQVVEIPRKAPYISSPRSPRATKKFVEDKHGVV